MGQVWLVLVTFGEWACVTVVLCLSVSVSVSCLWLWGVDKTAVTVCLCRVLTWLGMCFCDCVYRVYNWGCLCLWSMRRCCCDTVFRCSCVTLRLYMWLCIECITGVCPWLWGVMSVAVTCLWPCFLDLVLDFVFLTIWLDDCVCPVYGAVCVCHFHDWRE